jgi:hypothetical protein
VADGNGGSEPLGEACAFECRPSVLPVTWRLRSLKNPRNGQLPPSGAAFPDSWARPRRGIGMRARC